MKTIALIPARAGSKRIKSKNIRDFCGYPLIAYTIQQAKDANCFENIYVSTNDPETAAIADRYGASIILRPDEIAGDESTDYEWVVHALDHISILDRKRPEIYCILRPTSPFRQISSIIWGLSLIYGNPKIDSVRAVGRCDHPMKMWYSHKFIDGSGMITPLLPYVDRGTRPYDLPTQAFTLCRKQTAGLQVHRSSVITDGDISGQLICGIDQEELESWDINTQFDWMVAECLVKSGKATLPTIE